MKAKILNDTLRQIADLTGNATSKDEAIKKGLDSFLYLDNYPMYGGWNLIKVKVNGGGHFSFENFSSCGGRVKAQVMLSQMNMFISGLKYKK